jgi:GPN-loop GTPase
MPHGQIVVGPPGAGKTTYCAGLEQYFAATGRKVAIFNMDPANDAVPYAAAASIRDLVRAEAVAAELHLGPNGSLLYAMELLEKNFSWLRARMAEHGDKYLVFDFPGQVELYTHNDCVRRVVQRMVALNYRIAVVNLVDSHYCTDASKFIAVLLMSLTAIVQLELPAVNVLSKIDLIEQYGELPFSLEYFTESNDLSALSASLDVDPAFHKHARLNRALVELVEDFPWVGFHTLDIQDRESVTRVTRAVDKANGYSLANLEVGKATYSALVGAPERDHRWVEDVQERYTRRRTR